MKPKQPYPDNLHPGRPSAGQAIPPLPAAPAPPPQAGPEPPGAHQAAPTNPTPVQRNAGPTNPCIAVFGAGPEERLCGECAKLSGRRGDDDRTIYFCTIAPAAEAMRRVTAPACALFELSALSAQLSAARALRTDRVANP